MTYHTSKQCRYAAIPAVLAIALVAVTGGSVLTDAASAKPIQKQAVHNNNIKISRYNLLKACAKSGGKWHNGPDGYACDVNRKDGSSSHIECKNSGKCEGTNLTPQ